MTDSNRNISLGDVFPELASNLRKGNVTPVKDLFDRATVLLREAGKQTYINNVPAITTPYGHASELDGKTLYARIASYDVKTKQPEFIVFDETENWEDIVSENPQALRFQEVLGEIVIATSNGIEPVTGDRLEEYVSLVKVIVDDIATQHAKAKRTAAEAKATRKQALKRKLVSPLQKAKDYYGSQEGSRDYKNLGRERMANTLSPIVIGAVLLGVFYGPQIIALDADARLWSVPLPQPIEAIVDWANAPDHDAQGFAKPEGAAPIVVGQPVTEIPLLPAYSTQDAPDASYENSWDTGYDFDESRPGLYASDFDGSYHPERKTCTSGTGANQYQYPCDPRSAKFGDDGCYVILGNYRTGMTEVFTQTPGLNGKLTVEATDTKNLRVCLTDPKDETTNGTLYVYQNH